jgi:formylglycine-generating enzyme required for sulfatase activity
MTAKLLLWAVLVGCGSAVPASRPAPPENRVAAPPACPEDMALVPRGTFTMGHTAKNNFDYDGPPHRVALDAYCIDRTEVTVAAYDRCVAAHGCEPAPTTVDHLPGNPVYADPGLCNGGKPALARHPINCVTWNHADRFCRWAGRRLPTEAQWERSARGDDGRAFPWGDDPPVNDRGGPRVENRLNFAARDGVDGVSATMPVGSYPTGASPYGVLDLAGNVSEWTADTIGYYGVAPETNPTGPTDVTASPWRERWRERFGSDPDGHLNEFRVVRGGGMGFTDPKEYWTYARGTGLDVKWRDYDLGFRCAMAAARP